jgi:hypothetical protein
MKKGYCFYDRLLEDESYTNAEKNLMLINSHLYFIQSIWLKGNAVKQHFKEILSTFLIHLLSNFQNV